MKNKTISLKIFRTNLGSSTLDRKEKANDDEDVDDEKPDAEEPELETPVISRRNRYPGYGSSLGGSRPRPRWQSQPPPPPPSNPSFDDDLPDGNEWGRPATFGLK